MLNFLSNFFAGVVLSLQMLFGIHSAPVPNPISTSTVATSTPEQQASQQPTSSAKAIIQHTVSSKPPAQLNVQSQTTTQATPPPTQTTHITASSSAALTGAVDPSSLIATTPTPTITGSSNTDYVVLLGTLPADPLTGDLIASQAIPVENGRWSFSVSSNSYNFGNTSLCNGVYTLQLSGIDGNTSSITASSTLENTTFTVNAPENPNVCTPPTHL